VKGARAAKGVILEKQWLRSPLAGLVSDVRVKGASVEVVILEERSKPDSDHAREVRLMVKKVLLWDQEGENRLEKLIGECFKRNLSKTACELTPSASGAMVVSFWS
jgi:hypothetical protein